MERWTSVVLEPAARGADALVAELWTLGTLGIEETTVAGRPRVRAYFRGAPGPDLAAHPWSRLGARVVAIEGVEDRDWMDSFRRHATPFSLGAGFTVDPREPNAGVDAPLGRTLLRLPARRAFGIGSHESTRLVVEWLENAELGDRRVLDVGTGTGILALVALARGAASVVALDTDLAAGFAARANSRLNGRPFTVVVGDVPVLATAARFDLAMVNVRPESIESAVPRIAGWLAGGGRAIFSGLLERGDEWFERRLEAAGLEVGERLRDGDWLALAVRKAER